MAEPWHDDTPAGEPYKGSSIIDEDTADAISDNGLGHMLPDKTYSRPEFAYKAGLRIVGPSYFLLVKIEMRRGRIGWSVIFLHQESETTFNKISTV
jgi:hypothetical protein